MNRSYTPRGTARERILDVAERLFYAEGLRAVGIDRVIAESGIAKMTFYNHFKSKDELIAEYLRRRGDRWYKWFGETVTRHARTLEDRPLAIFDALEDRFLMPDYRGCAFINSIVELANPEHIATQAAVDQKNIMQTFIRQVLHEAGYQNCDFLAQQFMIIMDGAIVISLREGTPTAAQVAKKIAATLLAAEREHKYVHP